MPDRDLNRESAENIMGWYLQDDMVLVDTGRTVSGYFDKTGLLFYEKYWTPLTDMNQCMMVVEKMVKGGWGWAIEHTVVFDERKVEFYRDSDWEFADTTEKMKELSSYHVSEAFSTMDDIPRAILIAALEAKEKEKWQT